MEDELYFIVKAINRLTERTSEIISKQDKILKLVSSGETNEKYVGESGACKILSVSQRTLATMRKNNEIPWIKQHRKIMYPLDGLYGFLEKNCKH